MALPWYVAPQLEVVNHAMKGRSSRNFVAEGRLDAILADIRPDDVLLVQFGPNDQEPDPVGTDPWTTYPDQLRLYLDAARERGAVPVLLTSSSGPRPACSTSCPSGSPGRRPWPPRADGRRRGATPPVPRVA